MKKLMSIFMSVAMLLTMTAGLTFTAYAQTLTSGDYNYEILNDSTVQITKYLGDATEVTIPAYIEGKLVTGVGNSAFEDNRTLTEITVPDNIKSIGEKAFNYCFGLKKITVSDKVEYVGNDAFGNTADEWYADYSHFIDEPDLYYGGTALQWAKLVDGKTKGGWGFYVLHCETASNLDDFEIRFAGDKKIEIYGYYGSGSKIVIPSQVEDYKITSVYNFVCKENNTVKKITIGSNVKTINPYAFVNCKALESVSVSKSNKYFSSSDGVVYNKKKTELIAFPRAKKASSYNMSADIKEISEYAFYKCTGLKAINVSSKNKYFSSKDGVLFNKKKTTLVCYPAAKKNKTYTIPKSVDTVESNAFVNFKYLETLKLSKKVKSIEMRAFYGCKKLKNVYYSGSKSDWAKIGWHYTDDSGKIRKEKYKYKSSMFDGSENVKIHYNAKV